MWFNSGFEQGFSLKSFKSLYIVLKLEIYKPCGKESTEIRISQNKEKESENSYQKLKRSLKDRHTKTVSTYFDRQGRLYQSEESKCL